MRSISTELLFQHLRKTVIIINELITFYIHVRGKLIRCCWIRRVTEFNTHTHYWPQIFWISVLLIALSDTIYVTNKANTVFENQWKIYSPWLSMVCLALLVGGFIWKSEYKNFEQLHLQTSFRWWSRAQAPRWWHEQCLGMCAPGLLLCRLLFVIVCVC